MNFDFVAAAPAVGWEFQRAGKPSVVGQQEQPFGIEVEPSDGDDARQAGGKVRKNGVAPFFVFVGGNEPGRLVVEPKAGFVFRFDSFTVEEHGFGAVDQKGRRGYGFAVDGDAPLFYQFFGFAAGADAGAGQKFCYAFGHLRFLIC